MESWPNWDIPATKGDVMTALVLTQSCLVDAFVALSACRRNDDADLLSAITKMNNNMINLNSLVETLGGTRQRDD